MARVTPEEYAQKWAQRTQAASQDYARGVMRVQQAPGAQAAAKKSTYLARVNESANKWASKVSAVTLAEWQQMASTKGAQNLATGVSAAQPKMSAAAGKLLSTVDTVRSRVKQMPGDTLQQRLARATAMAQGMHDAYSK